MKTIKLPIIKVMTTNFLVSIRLCVKYCFMGKILLASWTEEKGRQSE